jgi:hypothetical protein
VAESLRWGANDFGGTLMEESITRMSGADHGQNLDRSEIEAAIPGAGRTPPGSATPSTGRSRRGHATSRRPPPSPSPAWPAEADAQRGA